MTAHRHQDTIRTGVQHHGPVRKARGSRLAPVTQPATRRTTQLATQRTTLSAIVLACSLALTCGLIGCGKQDADSSGGAPAGDTTGRTDSAGRADSGGRAGGASQSDDSGSPSSARRSTTTDPEFMRHLRQGIEQLRRRLIESAQAEFAKCAAIEADDPELLFQQARLAFAATRPPDVAGAVALLDRAIAADPDHVPARRMRYEIALATRDRQRAAQERAEIVARRGAPGATEMATFDGARVGDQKMRFAKPAPDADGIQDNEDLLIAFRKFNRDGTYDPGTAIPMVERILRRYPDLASIRLFHAQNLIAGQVRFDSSATHPDLPPMNSRVVLDLAQSHFERTLDQVNPSTPLSLYATRGLAYVAMQMGDYDDVLMWSDILLDWPGLAPPMARRFLSMQALAHHKADRLDQAIALYRRALSGEGLPMDHVLGQGWLLHLAYEEAGTPADQRTSAFRMRADLTREDRPGGLQFVDIAPELGIDKLDGLGPSAWGDYDGDGDDDLFVCGCDSYGVLYRNDGGTRFTDVSREAGLFQAQSGYSSTFADVDNDGDPDLYIGRDGWNGPSRNSLYRNNGDGTFTDVTDASGLGDMGSSFVHAWSDVDRDGDIDVYVANGITGSGDTNRLYLNDGSGVFRDATTAAGLAEPRGTKTIGIAFGDYDVDGWPDLLVSGHNTANRLYRNKGDGTFEEVAEKAGVQSLDSLTGGYVAFFTDVDSDGDPDILRTALAPWTMVLMAMSSGFDQAPPQLRAEMRKHCPKLYRNNGDGTFTDISDEAGLIHPIGIMGANVGDLDNDGFIDLYFGTGDPQIGRMEPDRFYRNDGDGTFTDVTFAVGLGNVGKGHGVTMNDLDGDGDLDIYAPEGGFVHGDPWHNAFYRNDCSNDNHWLKIDLAATKSNRDAIDTRVIVRAGSHSILRERKNGEGFGSSNMPALHIGLGAATKIEVEVHWPSGERAVYKDIPVDSHVVIDESKGWKKRG